MRTPLYDFHVALGARMAPFAGWEMPIEYDGILPEHQHARTAASIFDTCHMGEFAFQGPGAEADLERLVTMRIGTLREGQCRYGYLLGDDGGVLDDVTVSRRAADRFFMVVNAGTLAADAAWIEAHCSAGTRFEDRSPGRAKLDVQGPASRACLEEAVGAPLPELGYFRFTDVTLAGVPCTLSRTGYTGEWGYEIYFPAEETAAMWERLTAPGKIRPAGLGARDTLRLEVGYPLYGHELGPTQTPVPASRGMFVDMDKDFIGREAVRRDLDGGVPRRLAGLRLASRRAARTGDRVCRGDREVGVVTSGSLAPSLGVAVALAYVDREHAEPGTALEILVRDKPLAATVVELPFYRDGTARKKP
jgi:aminomethyltransferase